MTAYYNEIDPGAAQWLRNLIAAGHIAPGIVDERSIEDVYPSDLRGFTQCHFFAGVAVWSHALRQAGWSDSRAIWTGSCPCQPFSAAGQGARFSDQRHLWPAFFHLIEQCRPGIVVGEQVASADGLAWLDLVSADLEGAGYAVGALDTCAAGFGAPHIRQRLWFVGVAHAKCPDVRGGRFGSPDSEARGLQKADRERERFWLDAGASGTALADGLADTNSDGRSSWDAGSQTVGHGQAAGADSGIDANSGTSPTNGLWADADWLFCRDGKWRPVVASYVEMADGPSARMGRSRSDFLGNEEVETRLQAMRDTFDEEEIQRQAGRQWRFQEEGVLRSLLHGGLDGGPDQEHDSAEQQTPICENCGVDVRSLSSAGHKVPCASCGRESSEQRPLELEDIVHLLSLSLSLAELWGRREDAKRLRLLQRRLDEEGSMLHPSLAGKEAWASLGQDAKDRVGLDFDVGAWRRVVSFPLVDGNAFKQGSGHLFEGKSRAAMLRGYGNAICAPVAQAFIEAVMDSLGDAP